MTFDDSDEIAESRTFYLRSVWAVIASVGWYLIAALIALCYAWPYIQGVYHSWKSKKDEEEYAAKYHKNPDLGQERLSAIEAARQRMQEKYNQEAQLAKQREEERQERKRQEVQRLLEGQSVGRRLGNQNDQASTSKDSTSKSLKADYNPLMGDTSRGYRPPKRSCCGKGGCG